ncbi:MAG TPA: metalloregulator ArsR/SmtB family transcription factor [Candidatus Bathyarchaeia archaeon]|nr:metalloregulator ArsR/SmtB family transcription factor [Candidatus Bathyarchaeia archaeon]
MEEQTRFKAKIFRVLGDPTRLKILHYLRDNERCECEIVPYLGLAQPTVSRHLRILTSQGMLTFRKDGVRKMYSVSTPKIFRILESIDEDLQMHLRENAIKKLET